MKVILTPAAEYDLEQIADFIAADNPVRAISFLSELRESCVSLAKFPNRFPMVDRYTSVGVRKRNHGRYLIFYRVEPELVRVLHIVHGATDYDALLGEG